MLQGYENAFTIRIFFSVNYVSVGCICSSSYTFEYFMQHICQLLIGYSKKIKYLKTTLLTVIPQLWPSIHFIRRLVSGFLLSIVIFPCSSSQQPYLQQEYGSSQKGITCHLLCRVTYLVLAPSSSSLSELSYLLSHFLAASELIEAYDGCFLL